MDSAVPNIIVNPEKFDLVLHANEDCTFELTNVGYEAVIYRVRTTAPLRYYLKHSKGVVKGNSSAKITIFLNRKHFAEGTTPGQRYTKDTFRVECAVLGEQDVVEAHGANLANLIQKKKDQNKNAVVQKYIYCRVLMDAEGGAADEADADAAAGAEHVRPSTNSADGTRAAGNSSAGEDASADGGAGSRRSMTAKQMERSTLEEKRRRSDSGKTVVRGGHTMLIRLGVVAVMVLLLSVWMMRGGISEPEDEAE